MKIANLLLMYFLTHNIIFFESLILEGFFFFFWLCGLWDLSSYVCMRAQSCLTFLQSHRLQSSGSSVHSIIQARLLEWVAISFSRASSWPRDLTCVSCLADGFFTSEPTIYIYIKQMSIYLFGCSMQDPSSPTRDRTSVLCIGSVQS